MCADIFGGATIPNWLVAATHTDSGGLGKSLGTVLAGGLLALQPNEDGDGLKGIEQGLAEARMNQNDPTWRVKEKTLEANAVSRWTQAATQWQALDATKKDMSAWMTTDLPAITKFQEQLKTDPDAVAPVATSSKGLQAIGQLEKQQMAMQGMKLKQDNAKVNLENQKTSIAFDQAVSAAPQGIGSAIDELPNQGWNVDRSGKRTSPSTKALQLYNDWATDGGKNLDKAFGAKVTAVDVQKERNKGNVAVAEKRGEIAEKSEKQKQEDRVALEKVKAGDRESLAKLTGDQKAQFEKERQEDRVAVENLKQSGRVSIEKMKELAHVDASGKTLTRKEFINRHFNTVFANLRKNAPDSESPAQTAAATEQVLSGTYYRIDKQDAAAAKPATTTASPAPAPAPTTAKTTGSDPLRLFQ